MNKSDLNKELRYLDLHVELILRYGFDEKKWKAALERANERINHELEEAYNKGFAAGYEDCQIANNAN